MGTNQVWLTDEEQAKMTYIQEQKNKGKPLTEQKTVNQILQEWIRTRLELEEVKPVIDSLAEED